MKLHNFTKILNFRVISRKKEFQQQQPAADDDAERFFFVNKQLIAKIILLTKQPFTMTTFCVQHFSVTFSNDYTKYIQILIHTMTGSKQTSDRKCNS